MKTYTQQINNAELSARLNNFDLSATQREYHHSCVRNIYNRCRIFTENQSSLDHTIEGICFSQLISHIEEVKMTTENPIFKMSGLVNFYTHRLEELSKLHNSSRIDWKVHSTRLRAKIVSHFDDLVEELVGKEYVLLTKNTINRCIKTICKDTYDEALDAKRIANTIRKSLKEKVQQFKGNFENNCQEDSVDPLLLYLINSVLYGNTISAKSETQAALTMCQLIYFNVKSDRSSEKSVRHRINREPPLPIYVGLYLHSKTRKRDLIDEMNKLGISISYDRLLRITTSMSNACLNQYSDDKIVCPTNLRHGLFTTAAYDNIDHNPTSTTCETSFHGTSISMFQHRLPEQIGVERKCGIYNNSSTTKTVPHMLASYTNIKPIFLSNKEPKLPSFEVEGLQIDDNIIKHELEKEYNWLKSTIELTENKKVSWSMYHASNEPCIQETSIVGILPLFQEDSKSVAMLVHSLGLVSNATNFLNPGQIPIVVMDQPLYTLAKIIQWSMIDTYGEDKFLITFGSLHIEQAMLKALGKLLLLLLI